MVAVLVNDAYPIKTITYPGANDQYLKKETQKWTKYKPGDTRIQKIKPEIEFFQSQFSAGRYQSHIEHLEKAIEIATQFPTDIMTGDFTSRASSETTENITSKLVRGFQLYLCNKLKAELFEPILEQAGINTSEIDLDIAFTTQNLVELTVADIKELKRDGLMTVKEGRDWLRENTGMELPDDEALEQEKEEEDQQKQQMQNKIEKLENKLDTIKTNTQSEQKLKEIEDKIQHKLELLKEAMDNNKESLFKRREKVLDKMLDEASRLG
jgi:DNA-binding transcriptional MerR regulator